MVRLWLCTGQNHGFATAKARCIMAGGLNQVFEFLSALKNVPWGKVQGADLQKWIDDPQRLAIELQKFLKNFPQDDGVETQPEVQPILHRLFEDKIITLAPCDGSRYIAKEKGVFKAFIEDLFKSWGLNKRGKSTPGTNVSVFEMVKDATFAQMFGSLGSDLDKLCLSQHQIVEFCEKYPEKLLQDGYATFFLFKEGNQFYVAGVYVYSDGLHVHVNRLEGDGVWFGDCRHHVVVPHLPAGRQD